MPVITAGIDLAATPERTSLARIEWTGTGAVLREIICPAGDSTILEVIMESDKTGIDCPLGWPDAFADFVTAHRTGHVPADSAAAGPGWRRALTMRRTDAFVRETLGVVPLSVSADRIAHVAFRCAVLLAQLAAAGRPVDRTGAGPVAEVYPAASLRSWQLHHRGYKRSPQAAALSELATELLGSARWLDCGPHESLLRSSHDALDATVAALTARAASLGRTWQPSASDLPSARTEGWIAVPDSPLRDLA